MTTYQSGVGRVQGLGFEFSSQGLGRSVQVWGLGIRITTYLQDWGLGIRMTTYQSGVGFRVYGLGFEFSSQG